MYAIVCFMGKLAEERDSRLKRRLVRLRGERKRVALKLAELDRQISRLKPSQGEGKIPSAGQLNRWLDDLADGFPAVSTLPTDFSRADLYGDHD